MKEIIDYLSLSILKLNIYIHFQFKPAGKLVVGKEIKIRMLYWKDKYLYFDSSKHVI